VIERESGSGKRLRALLACSHSIQFVPGVSLALPALHQVDTRQHKTTQHSEVKRRRARACPFVVAIVVIVIVVDCQDIHDTWRSSLLL
jgi:hypothetical protein